MKALDNNPLISQCYQLRVPIGQFYQPYVPIGQFYQLCLRTGLTFDDDSPIYSDHWACPIKILMNLKHDVLLIFDLKSDPRFGLPDLDYPRSNYVLIINGQHLVVAKIDVLLTFDPKSDPRFGLPDLDYPRSNLVLTINGQHLVVAKIDVLFTFNLWPDTYTQTFYFFS